MKLCSRLSVLYCRSRPQDDKSRNFDPHFEKVRRSVEPWLMARWKTRVDFLFSVTELLFLSLTVETTRQTCQNLLLSGGGGSLWAYISGGRGRPSGIFFGFYKTRHILLYDSANCTVLCAVVLTQYRRVTDRRTDGIAIASTALVMRALWRAVKTNKFWSDQEVLYDYNADLQSAWHLEACFHFLHVTRCDVIDRWCSMQPHSPAADWHGRSYWTCVEKGR